MVKKIIMGILLVVFFLSGACALAYQIIWIRMFGLVFGGTVVSMSVVVAVFMGGLALGSHIIGKYAERIGNRVRLYGILEIILGLLAVLIYYGISNLSGIIYSLPINIDSHSFGGISVRIIISFALLIIPTMIMGGTLPVLVRAVTSENSKIIVNTSLLYAVNTLGAMTGAFFVGFLLIRYLGVTRSNHLTASINIIMGITALIVSGRFNSTPDTVSPGLQQKDAILHGKGLKFIVTLGITGFAGLTLEMVWMRMMLLVLNNTIYLYTIIITSYLFGLGLGGLMLRKIIPGSQQTERTFGIILAGISLTICAGYILFPYTTLYAFNTSYSFYSTFTRLSILTTVIFILLGFLPTFLMGASFPLGLGLYANEVRGLSRRLGIIYATNTAGSLLGSLAAVFILIPSIGMRWTLIMCAVMIMIPALYIISQTLKEHPGRFLLAGISATMLVFVIVSAKTDIPRSILLRRLIQTESIEYLKEGKSSTIWISGGQPFRKIWMDNLWVSSTSSEGTHALLAHYPVLFHPNPKKICGIAFGTGQTFGTCLLYPITSITSVEIDAEIIEACRGRFTQENYGILEDPRNTVVIDDGRFFLAGTKEKFDIVTAEPLQPYTRGTVSLYSYEFYEACKRTLDPGGIVTQWLPVYNSGVSDTWSMIRTFVEAFDYVLLFLNSNDGILLGSDSEMTINPSKPLPSRVLSDLIRIENGRIYALTGNFICSRESLLKASEGYPIITDDKPKLEFTAPISHWSEEITAEVNMRRQFIDIMEPIDSLFKGTVNWDLARKYHTSRKLINEGFYQERIGNTTSAHKLYEQAYSENPEDIKAIRTLFVFLRKFNRLNLLPQELQYLSRPPQKK